MSNQWDRQRNEVPANAGAGRSSRLGWYIASVWVVLAAGGFLLLRSGTPAASAVVDPSPPPLAETRPTNLPPGATDPCLLGTWQRTRAIASVFGPPTVTMVGNIGGQISFATDGTATAPASTEKFTLSGADSDGRNYELVVAGLPPQLMHFRAADSQIEWLDATIGHSGATATVYHEGTALATVRIDDLSVKSHAMATYVCAPHTSLQISSRGAKVDVITQLVWVG